MTNGDPTVTERCTALRDALTQWTMEPLDVPRDAQGLTHWACVTMNRAGDLCCALGDPSPFISACMKEEEQ